MDGAQQEEQTIDPRFERFNELNPEGLTADGFDDAYLGFITPFGGQATAVYSRPKCIEILMTRDGMDETEAEEFFSFNTEGAYVGPYTPMYLEPFEAA